MNEVPDDGILEYPEGTLQSIRKLYGLDKPEILKESMNALKEWVNKQEHFVNRDFERNLLEWPIWNGKGSIERAKERIDKYCTGKNLYSTFFETMDIRNGFSTLEQFRLVMLPKFAENFNRVIVYKMLKVPENSAQIMDSYKYLIIFATYLLEHHYFNGMIGVIDYSDVNLAELMKFINLTDTRQFTAVMRECFGIRIKGLHFVTSSSMFDSFITLLKQFLSPKVGQRLRVHKTYDTLRDFIPNDILPIDYGGKEITLAELQDKWFSKLSTEEHYESMKKSQEYRTDESRRRLVDFNDQYMGTPGSFRQFVVD